MTTRAVLFDMDGVLVDACEIHYSALNMALVECGEEAISREDHLREFNGLPTKEKLAILASKRSIPQELLNKIHERKQALTHICATGLEPDFSKLELLGTLRTLGIKIGVVSNALRKSVQEMLWATKLDDLVDCYLGNDDVEQAKPSPVPYLTAAELLKIPIHACVIVEDSPIGLLAAESAGARSVVKVEGPREVNLGLLENLL